MAETCPDYRVLLIEDEPGQALFVEKALAKAELATFVSERVECLAAARDRLSTQKCDAILLDLGLPNGNSLEVLEAVRSQYPEIPIVVLSSNEDDSVAAEAVAQGAQDSIFKGDLSSRSLERVLRYAMQRQQMLRELEEANQLLQQKNRRLAELCEMAHQFVDNVSHEFRTPLAVIKEFVTIMCDGLAGQVTEQQREFLEIVNDRVDDLTVMVDDMLDVSKLEAGQLAVRRQRCAVAAIIERVRPALERKATVKKAHFEITPDSNLPEVYCDPEKIGRVIINLVTNAIKFCGDGGSVKLWAKRSTVASDVVIGVADDGPGIAQENVDIIFDRFRQVEGATRGGNVGFGLGLAIAKDLVSLNLGEINVDSKPGQGSTFSFTVPFWNPKDLLDRYLRRAAQCCQDLIPATLVSAETDPEIEPTLADTADQLLQEAFRGDVLAIRILPYKWLIVAICGQREVDEMIRCVQTARAEADRNRPGERLPQIQLREQGTWDIRARADELIRRFENEMPQTPAQSTVRSVLVVDDDHDTRRGLQIRLAAAGYEVLTASDGHTAIHSAVQHRPDVILMDKLMPVMDGVTALIQLIENPSTKNIPVIMLSASLRDQQKALDHGARFFLQKPCTANTVMAALREVMEGPTCKQTGSGRRP